MKWKCIMCLHEWVKSLVAFEVNFRKPCRGISIERGEETPVTQPEIKMTYMKYKARSLRF